MPLPPELRPLDGPFARVLWACVSESREGGAEAADVRYSPASWRRRGVTDGEQTAVLAAIHAVAPSALGGMRCRWWVSLKVEASADEAAEAVAFALAARTQGVVGIDLSRSYDVLTEQPDDRPLARPDLVPCYAEAAAGGLELAVHAGRYERPADVWWALDELGARRLGHGLPLREDRALVARVAADEVLVEVCPSAALRQAPGERHQLAVWLDAGVRVGLGTDHPLAFGTTWRQELHLATAWLARCGEEVG